MIIINERKYVEDILLSNQKPDKVGIRKLIMYVAKYYYPDWGKLSTAQYVQNIFDRLAKFKLNPIYFQEFQYFNYTKNLCNKLKKGKISPELRDVKEVVLSEPEIKLIQSASNEKEQKVLFALYVLGKIFNTNGWINYPTSDIFQLASVTMKKWDREDMIGNMRKQGLLTYSKSTKNSVIKIELMDGDPEFIVNDFKKLGNQYISVYKTGWIMCKNCGKLVKKHGKNQKYCKKCSKIIEKEKQVVYNHRSYEKLKNSRIFENPANPCNSNV